MLQAVYTMNEMMGITGEGPLPAQVQELVVTTSVVVTITPAACYSRRRDTLWRVLGVQWIGLAN
eukprot:1422147-Prymnesium_polylepis.1